MKFRIVTFAALAVLFLVSLVGLVARLTGITPAGDSGLVLPLWLGATVLSGAGLAFVAARFSMRGHARSGGRNHSAAYWGNVMDGLPTGFAVYDADSRLVFCNEPWRRLFADIEGIALIGSTYSDTVLRISGRRRTGSHGSSLSGERQIEGGTWVRFEESKLDDGGFLISVSDITKERMRASEARVEREKMRLVVSAAGSWIWETDVLHRFSLAVPVRTELSRDELDWMIGRGLSELGPPAVGADDTALSKCIEDMQEQRRLTHVDLLLHDGERTRGVRLSGVPRVDDDGAFLGYCGVGAYDSAPAEVRAVPAPGVSRRLIDPSDPRGQRILLVDDSQTNRLLGVSILKKMGYDCDAVENGQQAIDAVRQGAYGLVLMDIRMPGMDGFQATAQIRNLPEPDRSVPIVAMTAHVNPEDRQLCLESGMDDHVSKPVDRRILSSVLRRLIGPPAADTAGDVDGGADREGAPDVAQADAAQSALTDNATLEQLRADAGAELVSELIASFMTETDERLLRMQTAMQSGDLDSVAAEAHAMKSSSGTFGALRLQSLVARLEAAATGNDTSLASQLLDGLPGLVAESWREFALAGYPPPK